MSHSADHDRVVRFIAANRFPFPDQTDWPKGYTTLVNVGRRARGIEGADGPHWPDIVILDETGAACRFGEVEEVVDAAAAARWKLCSEAADTLTETGVRNLFVYVPKGQGRKALAVLDEHGISFAGLREYEIDGDRIGILPVATRGDSYDHRTTAPTPISEAGVSRHDAVVAHVAATRFPFHDQTDWPTDYVTLTNAGRRARSIPHDGGEHFPDIVIINATGEVREIGEVEEGLDEDRVPVWRTCSLTADNLTESGNRHFFLYVPAGQEAAAVALLDRHTISFAGVRGYTVGADGRVGIVPHVTRGDAKDHR